VGAIVPVMSGITDMYTTSYRPTVIGFSMGLLTATAVTGSPGRRWQMTQRPRPMRSRSGPRSGHQETPCWINGLLLVCVARKFLIGPLTATTSMCGSSWIDTISGLMYLRSTTNTTSFIFNYLALSNPEDRIQGLFYSRK